jgi:pSer/pThr/pTyr-binding forkhead associated (FHA) protein
MPKLTLKFKDNTLGDYPLNKGRSVTIGRRNDNDVVIDNLAVSGHHAKIDSVGDGFVLIDLQSKNGSFVNEQLINSHWLKPGDVISIGKHSLFFQYCDGEVIPDDGSETMDKTMIMDTSQYRSMVQRSKPSLPKPLTRSKNSHTVGVLTYLSGGNGEMKLSGKLTKIGKHPSSDIVVKGLTVGKTAATISKRPDGFYLSYVGGMSKPKVNEHCIKLSVILKDLDIIEIGSTKFQFIEKPHQGKPKA